MSNQIIPQNQEAQPTAFDAAMERLAQVRQMMQDGTLIRDEDYGVIPRMGKKPTLYKPGAQKLMAAFSLASVVRDVVRESRFDELSGGSKKEVVSYRVIVTLQNKLTGMVEAEGVGSCSTGESRYSRQKAADIDNTVLKMARKRALVDATLDATGASSLFTQDVEDMPQLDDMRPSAPAQRQSPPPAPPAEPTDQLHVLARRLAKQSEPVLGKPLRLPRENASADSIRRWIERVNEAVEKAMIEEDEHQTQLDAQEAELAEVEDAVEVLP